MDVLNMNKLLIDNPNHHSQAYRHKINPNMNLLHAQLDAIDYNGGCLLIGSSNVTGRYWDGSVAYYNNYESLLPKDKHYPYDIPLKNATALLQLSSGVTNARFLNKSKDKFLTTEDNASIKLIGCAQCPQLPPEASPPRLIVTCEAKEHHGILNALSITDDDRLFVTGCAAGLINVWDLERREPCGAFPGLHTFNKAHNDSITGLEFHHSNFDIFVSCGLDREALLWDVRLEKPATDIYTNEFCGLSRIAWHPVNEHIVTIATQNGDIYFVDVRHPFEFIAKDINFQGGNVTSMRYNKAGYLAVCGETENVRVLDCRDVNTCRVLYDNSAMHADVVTGVAWVDTNQFVSCSWDGSVVCHNIVDFNVR